MTMTVEVTAEPTRNEHSVIFQLNKDLIPPGTGLPFSDAIQAESNPLAEALFQIPGVISVWILGNEVQVTKADSMRWGSLKSKIIETIKRLES